MVYNYCDLKSFQFFILFHSLLCCLVAVFYIECLFLLEHKILSPGSSRLLKYIFSSLFSFFQQKARIAIHLQIRRHSSSGQVAGVPCGGSSVLRYHYPSQSVASPRRCQDGCKTCWRTSEDGGTSGTHQCQVPGYCYWYAIEPFSFKYRLRANLSTHFQCIS